MKVTLSFFLNMWTLTLYLVTVAYCLADNPENDGEASRKVLGSSVVTSISVILDNGNGSKIYTDAVGNPVSKPLTASDLASPIDLLNPDRYEFYTFDDNGELVKRLMTLEEIQDIIATGDGEGLSLDSLASGLFPEKRVDEVVNNVQSVLKSEMENLKDVTNPPIFDTPDVSDSWSMILPAVFGNSGEDIKPEKPAAHVTPDTIMIEPTYPSSTRKPSTQSSSTKSTKVTEKPSVTTTTSTPAASTTSITKTIPLSTTTTTKPTTKDTTSTTTSSTTIGTVSSTFKPSVITTTELLTSEEKILPLETTTIKINRTEEPIHYIEIKPLLSDAESTKNNIPLRTSTRKPETTLSIKNATLISVSSSTVKSSPATMSSPLTSTTKPTTKLTGSSTVSSSSTTSTTITSPSSTTPLLTTESVFKTESSTSKIPSTTTIPTTEFIILLRTEPSTPEPSSTSSVSPIITKEPESASTSKPIINEQQNQVDSQVSETIALTKNFTEFTTVADDKLITTTDFTNYQPEKEYTTTENLNIKTEPKLPTTDILEQLLLTSTKISEINSELSEKPSTNFSTKFETTTDLLITNSLDEKTTTETDTLTTTDQSLAASIEQLISQAITNVENPIPNMGQENMVEGVIVNSGNKTMIEMQKEAATVASNLMDIETTTTQKIALNDIESDSTVLDSVGSLLSQVIESGSNIVTTDQPITTTLFATTNGVVLKEKQNEVPESRTTEEPIAASTEIPKFTTEVPQLTSSEVPKLASTELFKVVSTDTPIVTSTEASKSIPTELPKIFSTEIPEIDTTEVPKLTEVPEYISTALMSSSTSEVPISTELDITEISKLSSTEAPKSSTTTETVNETPKVTSTVELKEYFTQEPLNSTKTETKIKESTTEAFVPHLINITIINRNHSKPAKADLSLEAYYENELKKNISLLEQKTEASTINLSTTELNREASTEVLPGETTTTGVKVGISTLKPKDSPLKPLIVININENSSSVASDDSVAEQDKTESLWTPVSTLSPHADTQKTTETSPHVIPSRIEEIVEPPVPVDLVPKPLQGFGLEESTSNLDPDIYNFVQLCNELSFDFWRSVTTGISTARSLVVSPFAATSLLAMVFLGARGATSGEMNEILKLDDMVTFNPHLIFKNISESIKVSHESGVAISTIIRELFSDRSKGKLLSFYKERVKQFYDGHAEEVSFKEINDIIRRRTNLLVRKSTGGKIQEYLKDSSISMRPPLAGLSVSIFQTDCSHASHLGHDGEMHFVVLPSIRQRRLIPIPAVVYRANFLAGYEPSLDATAVALGTKDQAISTIFVIPGQQGVPAPGDGLARLEKRLVESAFKKGAWSRLLRSLVPRPGLELQIPRFSHKSVINASISLQKMGLKDLFDARKADLRGLNGVAHELHLSDMLQINNFATCGEDRILETHHIELYPATAERSVRKSRNLDNYEGGNYYLVGDEPRDYQRAFHDPLHDPSFFDLPLSQRPRQARLPETPRLRFDRPFLFFVRHNPTGAILHMGRFHPRLLP